MQIQRIQTIYLFLAAVVTALFLFVPFGSLTLIGDAGEVIEEAYVPLKPTSFFGLLIPAATACVLLLIDIFLYNNFRLQKSVLIAAMMLILVSMGLVIYINCDHATEGTLHWGGGGLLLVAAMIGAVAAMVRIRYDERLLRSSNRLF